MSRAQLAAVVLMLAGGGVLIGRACQQAESNAERAVYLGAAVLTIVLVTRRARGPVTGGGSVVTRNVIQLVPRQAGLAA